MAQLRRIDDGNITIGDRTRFGGKPLSNAMAANICVHARGALDLVGKLRDFRRVLVAWVTCKDFWPFPFFQGVCSAEMEEYCGEVSFLIFEFFF